MKLADKKENKNKEKGFDYASYEKEVVAGLIQGKGLMGEEGLLKPLIARFVEAALDAEMSDHLEAERNLGKEGNRRNGPQKKMLRTPSGETTITYKRDRRGTFEPVTLKKWQHDLPTGFDNQILELYAMGNSLSDIALHLRRMYGLEMSESRLSAVINGVWDVVSDWHKRPLPACYVVLFIDAVHIDIR